MWPLVTLTANKYLYFLGSVLLAAIIATSSATPGATGVNGGAIYAPDFSTAGVASRTLKVPISQGFLAFVRGGTGATNIKYPGSCFRNPLNGISRGSGTVVRLTFHMGDNPTGAGGDVGIVKGCGDSFGSGSRLLIDNVTTASGATSYYTTGTAILASDDYIKFTPTKTSTGMTARISGWVEDNWKE